MERVFVDEILGPALCGSVEEEVQYVDEKCRDGSESFLLPPDGRPWVFRKEVSPSVTFLQPLVLLQRQKDGSCGYHALKNSLWIFQTALNFEEGDARPHYRRLEPVFEELSWQAPWKQRGAYWHFVRSTNKLLLDYSRANPELVMSDFLWLEDIIKDQVLERCHLDFLLHHEEGLLSSLLPEHPSLKRVFLSFPEMGIPQLQRGDLGKEQLDLLCNIFHDMRDPDHPTRFRGLLFGTVGHWVSVLLNKYEPEKYEVIFCNSYEPVSFSAGNPEIQGFIDELGVAAGAPLNPYLQWKVRESLRAQRMQTTTCVRSLEDPDAFRYMECRCRFNGVLEHFCVDVLGEPKQSIDLLDLDRDGQFARVRELLEGCQEVEPQLFATWVNDWRLPGWFSRMLILRTEEVGKEFLPVDLLPLVHLFIATLRRLLGDLDSEFCNTVQAMLVSEGKLKELPEFLDTLEEWLPPAEVE